MFFSSFPRRQYTSNAGQNKFADACRRAWRANAAEAKLVMFRLLTQATGVHLELASCVRFGNQHVVAVCFWLQKLRAFHPAVSARNFAMHVCCVGHRFLLVCLHLRQCQGLKASVSRTSLTGQSPRANTAANSSKTSSSCHAYFSIVTQVVVHACFSAMRKVSQASKV